MQSFKYILFIFIITTSAYAKKIDFIVLSEINQWEALTQVCEKSNRPIFLMIAEKKETDNNFTTFTDDKHNVKFVNQNFVSVRVNSGSQLGATFISLFGLDDESNFIIFNPQEIILSKTSNVTLDWFEKGLTRFNNYSNLISKYEKQELSRSEWLEYLDISYYNLGYANSMRNANIFTLTLNDNDLKDTVLWGFILNYCVDINNVVFKTIRNNPSLLENPNKTFPWKRYYANCYNLNLEFAINNNDSIRMDRMLKELVPLYPDSTKWEDQKLLIEQQYYGNKSQWKYYDKVTSGYLDAYAKDSSEFYLKEASKLYNNYYFDQVDSLIIKFLIKGIEIGSSYDLQMSLANIYIIKKDYQKATKHANEAVKESENETEKRKALNLRNYLNFILGY